ncbi:capping complex subunit for YIEGIA [Fervidibacillus halotolerans]|uniref:Uncharacterized protein n=1 Tax=Fervidibacillus halotolerans TaxID=2980027 RepID=A0A9E8RZC2_9BACI|nr:hypothetical protein [Fervidibacillus halotolerans]WAA13771.1 hypothetical protein OE105_06635 [Fervidibacillus halotolerans]
MEIEKLILAVITTNPSKVPAGSWVFYCENEREMKRVAVNLEAILDGIAHLLTDDVMIIVKH